MRIQNETVIDLPWLAPYDKIMAGIGYGGTIIKTTAPAGSDIEVDPAQKRARVLYPSGKIKAWADNAEMDLDPGESYWRVNWRVPGTLDKIVLSFEPFEEDDEDDTVSTDAQVYSEDFEGHEAALFPAYVRLLKDTVLNPHGFHLSSGLYRQEGSSIRFEVNFEAPYFRVRRETLPAELTYPYITDISIEKPLTLRDDKGITSVAPGFYRTTVSSFNIHTGAAVRINCKPLGSGSGKQFTTNDEQLTQLIHEGSAEIMKIVKYRRPNY